MPADIRQLRIAGPGLKHDLGPVSLTLPDAGCSGLLGRSGSGKSTLLRALAGRLPPQWEVLGTATLDGQPCPLRRGIPGTVLVTQDAQSGLDPLARVRRLLRWAAGRDAGERIEAVTAAMGLDYPTLSRQRAGALSGGMRHRVLLAMALLRRPRVLLLDEPTSALDADTAKAVLQTLDDDVRSRGATALIASHDLDAVARRCKVLHYLFEGRITDRWSPDGAPPGAHGVSLGAAAQAHLAAQNALQRP